MCMSARACAILRARSGEDDASLARCSMCVIKQCTLMHDLMISYTKTVNAVRRDECLYGNGLEMCAPRRNNAEHLHTLNSPVRHSTSRVPCANAISSAHNNQLNPGDAIE